MEDTEMPSRDLKAGTDVTLVDAATAGVQEDISTDQPEENQKNPIENGTASASELDKTDALPTDVHMSENQPLPDNKSSTSTTTDAAVNDAISIKVPENKDDGDGAVVLQNQPEALAVTPPANKKHSTPRTKHESAAKSKGVWTDIEVLFCNNK